MYSIGQRLRHFRQQSLRLVSGVFFRIIDVMMPTLQIIRYEVDTPKHLTAIANWSGVSAVAHDIREKGTAIGHEINDLSKLQAKARHLLT